MMGPPERILVESDHGYNDPPAAIPCRIEWVERLVAQQLRIDVTVVRLLVWRNYARIIHHNKLEGLMPPGFLEIIQAVNDHPWDGFQQVAF